MGKKRNAGGGAFEADGEPKEEKRPRKENASFSELSQTRLVAREKELAEEVRAMQDHVTRARRAAGGLGYGNNDVRQMNTKRLRAEYAHQEVQGEIERRKKAGKWALEPDGAMAAVPAQAVGTALSWPLAGPVLMPLAAGHPPSVVPQVVGTPAASSAGSFQHMTFQPFAHAAGVAAFRPPALQLLTPTPPSAVGSVLDAAARGRPSGGPGGGMVDS